jgi:ABC-type branched-subunit amino acid transport system substrate-binding protein
MAMTTSSRRATITVVAVLAITVAACGTQADREAYLESRRVVIVDDGSTETGGETDPSSVADGTATGPATAGATGSRSVTAGGAPQAGDTAAPGAPGAPASGAAAPGIPDGVSTDVVGDTIRIGMHLPETGAAPLPTDWADALAVVEQYLNDQHPASGRTYDFVVEDDGYDPAKGLAACRKLADDDVLLVIGHSQPAVQDACAGLFDDRRIPYVMRGAQESILRDRPLAWMGTITDDRQGRLLGDYAIHQLDGANRKAAVLFENDQLASRDGFIERYEAGGGEIVAVEETEPRQPDFSATIEKLRQSGAEIVFLSQPPVDVIKVAVQAQGQGYHPTWVGGATYWNYNLVLESAGAALDGAVTFSPWPSVDSAAAAEYRDVFRQYRPGKDPSDVGLVIWGWASVVRAVVEAAGPDLSRASIVGAFQNLQVSPPAWNPLTFTPDEHRGSTSVAVFAADGQAKRWRQIADFTDSL